MSGVLSRRQEVRRAAHRALQHRVCALHDHRVDPDAGHHREVVLRSAVHAQGDQVDFLVQPVEGDVEGGRLVQRDADFAG